MSARAVAPVALSAMIVACASPDRASTPPVASEARVLATGFTFVEGPVWIESEGRLVFSDIPERLHRTWSPEAGAGVLAEMDHPNGNALDPDGRLVTCLHGARAIVRRESDGRWATLVDRVDGARFNSPNDLAIQRDGVIWFTDPPWGLERQRVGRERDTNGVFRFDPRTGDVRVVLETHAMPNGIALSPDETVLYVSDTGGHASHPDPRLHEREATISAYRVAGAELASGPPLWSVDARSDGMCVDAYGRLFSTGREAVAVWSPDGEHLLDIPIPEGPANVCLGGEASSTLFVTARTSLYAVDLR